MRNKLYQLILEEKKYITYQNSIFLFTKNYNLPDQIIHLPNDVIN